MSERHNKPSWLRWPPNCCETCVNWQRAADDKWIGRCQAGLVAAGEITDARYRCPDFKRKAGV